MDWQTLFVIILGLVALLYVGNVFMRQFKKVESNSECGDCPVIEDKNL